MKQSSSRRAIAGLLAPAFIAAGLSSASAQASGNDISGQWRFRSASFEDDCIASGAITLRPAKSGAFDCAFVIETHCKYATDKVQEYWRVSETCTAKQTGFRVQVTSRIGKIEAATYFGKAIPASEQPNYMPDNFDLMLKPSGAEMTGHLFDPIRRVPMRFWREAELMS